MEFVSVFDEASRDYESEDREHRLTAATVEAQTLWPFLALAQSTEEFGHRLALRQDRLSAIAVKHGVDLAEVVGPFYRGFEALHTQAKVRCRRCNHDNAPHTQGAVCPCGCTTFTPRTAGVTSKKVAGRDEWEHDCTNCGVTTTSTREHQDCPSCGEKAEEIYTSYKTGTYDSPENHQCENDGSGRCKHCSQEIPQDLQPYASRKQASPDDPPSDYEVANYSSQHGDAIEDHYGPSYDPEVVHELPLHGTKSNPVYFYNEGYHHGHQGVEYKGYGGRDAAILYGTGYRHGKADRVATKPEFDPHQGSWQGHMARLHEALMDGQDPLTWIQQQAPPPAQTPTHHDTTQKFVADDTTGGNRDALDQALDKEGSLPF